MTCSLVKGMSTVTHIPLLLLFMTSAEQVYHRDRPPLFWYNAP